MDILETLLVIVAVAIAAIPLYITFFTKSPADRVLEAIKERGPYATITIGETVEVEYHE